MAYEAMDMSGFFHGECAGKRAEVKKLDMVTITQDGPH